MQGALTTITAPSAALDARFGNPGVRNNWWNRGTDARFDFPFDATGGLTAGTGGVGPLPLSPAIQNVLPAPTNRPECRAQYNNPALNFRSYNPNGCRGLGCPRPTIAFSNSCGCGCAVVPPPRPPPIPPPPPVPGPVPGSRVRACDRRPGAAAVCPQIYLPTCGCRVESVTGNVARLVCNTYPNQCTACADTRNVFTYDGPCGGGGGRYY